MPPLPMLESETPGPEAWRECLAYFADFKAGWYGEESQPLPTAGVSWFQDVLAGALATLPTPVMGMLPEGTLILDFHQHARQVLVEVDLAGRTCAVLARPLPQETFAAEYRLLCVLERMADPRDARPARLQRLEGDERALAGQRWRLMKSFNLDTREGREAFTASVAEGLVNPQLM